MKNDLNLSELCPEAVTIPLMVKGEQKEFTIPAVSLRDIQWAQKKFGDLGKAFQDLEKLSQFLFRVIKEKETLQAEKRKEWNADGTKEVEVMVTGPQRVLEGIVGVKHQEYIGEALQEAIGMGQPVPDVVQESASKNEPSPAVVSA